MRYDLYLTIGDETICIESGLLLHEALEICQLEKRTLRLRIFFFGSIAKLQPVKQYHIEPTPRY